MFVEDCYQLEKYILLYFFKMNIVEVGNKFLVVFSK